MSKNSARIISLVPSWTETLLWAELSVVGRTRFCIHPADVVAEIPALGGTKGIDLEKVLALRPDFVIMDQEENKKETAEQLIDANIEIIVSHVTSLEEAAQFLKQISVQFDSKKLLLLSQRYEKMINQKIQLEKFFKLSCLKGDWKTLDLMNLDYVIWKNPFMVIGQNTFISEVLKLAQIQMLRLEKYPIVSEFELLQNSCLLSSEPYPFQKDFQQMQDAGFKAIIVDGEKISWYGIRNLLFLEECLE